MELHFSPRRLLLPCLLLPLLIGQSAAGDDLTDAKEISISIRLHQQWENYDQSGGNYRETGQFTITIRGTIAPMAAGKQRKDYIIFEPKGMKATASFSNKWIEKKTGRIDDTETGDGAVDIVPASAVGQPSEQGHFLLQAFRDRLARVRVAQMTGNTDPMAMLKIMRSKQNQDNYRFNVTVPLKTRATKRGERMRGLHFVLDCARLAEGTLAGSVSWTSKKRKPALLYRSFPAVLIRPDQAEGSVTQSVSWQIGEVPPQVVLFRHVKGQWQQVGQDKTADVLIGRRVRLKAEVHGAKGAAAAGAWSVPGTAVTDWRGSLAKSELTSLNPRQAEIRFVWVEGDVAGAARVVGYSATVGGQRLSAETRFKVFSPTVTLKVEGPKSVEVALATEDRPGAK
ncbi:MAG: hypothetical protein KAI25_08210, partial [Hyphomicrobiaceae bacterium]|nr:hypothetical protein [Hyphomicrobiaceae bacterium]